MNTQDISKFGYREKRMAAELLLAHCSHDKDATDYLGEGVAVKFNPISGCVFLVDEDYNVAMMDGDVLRDWITTPYEGEEGFLHELLERIDELHEEDQEYIRELNDA